MKSDATTTMAALAAKGAFADPAAPTSHSLTTPLMMATTLLTVLIRPKVRERSAPFSARRRFPKSVTIQLSKTLKRRLVAKPPRTRPRNSSGRDVPKAVRRHEAAEARQKTRQAVRRPWRSAREPMNGAVRAPERKPVVKRRGMM
jgi:hypothetical protein